MSAAFPERPMTRMRGRTNDRVCLSVYTKTELPLATSQYAWP